MSGFAFTSLLPNRQDRAAAAIIAATFFVYLPLFGNGFTNWDDGYYIVHNPDITRLTLASIGKIFSSFYVAQYVPLVVLSYAVEIHFFGLDPFVVHSVSLILHVVNSVLAYRIVQRWGVSERSAFLAALLFGIHPIHTEAVAWASARKDILSTFFLFLTLLQYDRAQATGRLRDTVFTLLLYLAALCSKATVMFLPFYLAAEAIVRREQWRSAAVRLLPYFLLSLFFSGLVLYSLGEAGGLRNEHGMTMIRTVVIASYSVLFTLFHSVIPAGLSAVYPFPWQKNDTIAWFVSAAPLLLLLIAGLVWKFRVAVRPYAAPVLFFLIALLPTLQIVSFGAVFTADRFAYIPFLAVATIAAAMTERWWGREDADTSASRGLLAIILVCYGLVTWNRTAVWKDSETMWSDAIRQYPDFPIAYYSRGQHYFSQNRLDKAITDLSTAITLAPNYPHALNLRGYIHAVRGERNEAREDFDRVIALQPLYAMAYFNRGMLLLQQDSLTAAVRDLSETIRLDTTYDEAYVHRGIIAVMTGKDELAERDLSAALQRQPEHVQANLYRGIVRLRNHRPEDALLDLRRAWSGDPTRKETAYQLSLAFQMTGRMDSSEYYFELADELGRGPARRLPFPP